MKMIHWASACALMAVATLSFAEQPHMEGALEDLQKAKTQLQKATADKGGHRVKAIKAIDAAIAEINAGIAFDRSHSNEARENKRPASAPAGK